MHRASPRVPAGVGLTFGVWLFKSGPLAWNGVLAFWVAVTTYFTWLMVTTVMTGQAIRREDEAPQDGATLQQRVAALEATIMGRAA